MLSCPFTVCPPDNYICLSHATQLWIGGSEKVLVGAVLIKGNGSRFCISNGAIAATLPQACYMCYVKLAKFAMRLQRHLNKKAH